LEKLLGQDDGLPLVAISVKKSYDHGGQIYIHFDGVVKDFIGINSKDDDFFKERLAAEPRYLIDNGLVDKGRVEFFLGANPLPANLQKKLAAAIQERKYRVKHYPNVKENKSQKGNYEYEYN